MRVHIDVDMNECQDHGQCIFVAPETFRFSDEGRLEYDSDIDVDEEGMARLEEAADICPLQAIVIRPA
jgi:ferredoxin